MHLSLVIGAQVEYALATAGFDDVVIAVHRLPHPEPAEWAVVQAAERPGRDEGLDACAHSGFSRSEDGDIAKVAPTPLGLLGMAIELIRSADGAKHTHNRTVCRPLG